MPAAVRGYEVEVLWITFLVVFSFNFFRGKIQNELVAEAWAQAIKGPLTEQFTLVGTGDAGNPAHQETYTNWRISCTGRTNCIGLEARLELAARQDLLKILYYALYKRIEAPESFIIDVAFEPEVMDSVAVLIGERSVFREAKGNDAYQDVRLLSKDRPIPEQLGFPLSFLAAADSIEALELALPQRLGALLAKHAREIKLIHITDKNPRLTKLSHVMRFEFRVPERTNMARLTPLLDVVFQYIDHLATARLSETAREKARLRRVEAQKKLLSSEEAKEKRQAEQEEIAAQKIRERKQRLAALSPEERAREEEKDRRRAQKKKQAGGKVKIVLH